ncbi:MULTISPECIES: hypothetical protein [unclassified Variovorax]|uniref:hypothetical protein n=1 Tax=unclassified Variovorax TaxID=663243 RepID=UPI001BD4AA7B|nr:MULTISPECIES: hypothetical protein [unclassified Variovorax]
MIIPAHWAEGRVQDHVNGQQVTVRRFGWSDESAEAAQRHADARTLAAFDRIASGEQLARRERKVAYNGADGMPIREEIVQRAGDAVITRNSYGALCLNTPDVLFLDIDFESHKMDSGAMEFALGPALIAGLLAGWSAESWIAGAIAAVAVFAVALRIGKDRKRGDASAVNPGPEKRAKARIARFMQQHADWHLRIYRTPAGFRLLAMHDVFDPASAAVTECFRQLGVDKVYARMCQNQGCFRARLTAKPWRIGIADHLRPRPGVWPVAPERLPMREAWVRRYDASARGHAACRFLEAVGSAKVHPAAQRVQDVHDQLSQATSGLPIA